MPSDFPQKCADHKSAFSVGPISFQHCPGLIVIEGFETLVMVEKVNIVMKKISDS